jgi:hypothetical protein
MTAKSAAMILPLSWGRWMLLSGLVWHGCALASAETGEIVDRMVAIVDGAVVTRGDIEEYRALARYFGDTISDDDGVILAQIIEDMLISRQLAQFPGNAIREGEVEAYLEPFEEPEELSPERVRAGAGRRIELERYYQSLMRSLRASEEEILALYEDEFVPELRAQGAEVVPPLAEVRTELQSVVLADKLREELARRVEGLYRRYQVEVVE